MAAIELYSSPLYSDANLVAYYRLEDVNDTMVGARTLTNNGTISFVSCLFNNGADLGTSNTTKWFNRSSDYYTLTTFNASYSISLWVKIRTEPSSSYYWIAQLTTDNNATTNGVHNYIYYDDTGGTKTVNFRRWNTVSTDTVTYTGALGTSNWHHLVMTYDGSNIRGYVDGSKVNTVASTLTAQSGRTLEFALGGSVLFAGSLANAYFDDAAVFSRALTDNEIYDLYAGYGGKITGITSITI